MTEYARQRSGDVAAMRTLCNLPGMSQPGSEVGDPDPDIFFLRFIVIDCLVTFGALDDAFPHSF